MTDMTVGQVATACGVTERTVRRWLAEGRLPAMRTGGRVRIPAHALREVQAAYLRDPVALPSPVAATGALRVLDGSGLADARLTRATRAERLLDVVRAMAAPTQDMAAPMQDEDAAALVRAGRDAQDARWDR